VRCIFCKSQTSTSEPLEHIIPESLGNKDHILKRGVVCGRCNNYFSHKVEKLFLELFPIKALRFYEAIPSKKKRIPSLTGIIFPDLAVIEAVRNAKNGNMSLYIPEENHSVISFGKTGQFILPAATPLEASLIISRFMAKIAVEALAYRVETNDEWMMQLVDNKQLDLVRNHARYGVISNWPVSVRRIYDTSTRWNNNEDSAYQIVHEFDFLRTDSNEIYFVLAIFGEEIVMNIGGPNLEGWKTWISKNDNASPLYHGKNTNRETKL